MTTIGSIGAAPNPAAGSSGTSGLGNLDSEAFLNLLVAQLRYQNPMEPTDHTAMLQQTAQFTQIETLQKVLTSQQQLLGLSHASIAADLVGKEVVARTDGGEITGVVDSVRFTASGPALVIGDQQVPLDAATEIRRQVDA